jgi:hypothetical protein
MYGIAMHREGAAALAGCVALDDVDISAAQHMLLVAVRYLLGMCCCLQRSRPSGLV